MDTPPAFIAFAPGLFLGLIGVRFLIHWIALLFTALGQASFGTPKSDGRIWATLFTVFHPAPWLIAFGAYKVIRQPPSGGWRWFFAGTVCSFVLCVAGGFYATHKARKRITSKKNLDEPERSPTDLIK